MEKYCLKKISSAVWVAAWKMRKESEVRDGVELGPSLKDRRLGTVFLGPTRPEPDFLKDLILHEKSG